MPTGAAPRAVAASSPLLARVAGRLEAEICARVGRKALRVSGLQTDSQHGTVE
jgi:hypothetical protein